MGPIQCQKTRTVLVKPIVPGFANVNGLYRVCNCPTLIVQGFSKTSSVAAIS